MYVRRIVGILTVGLCLGRVASASAQVPPPPPAAAPAPPAETPVQVDVSALPVSVERIERQLESQSPLTLEVTQPMFRIEVVESRPKWFTDIEWLPEHDPHLPMPSGAAWPREHLAMVTPQMARPFGHASGLDLLQLIATSFAEGVAVNALVGHLQKTSKRRASEARAEVDAAIEAWKRQREAAAVDGPPTPDVADPQATPSSLSPPR
jgi:hypothetical protein